MSPRAARADLPPLIPRSVLFGNPVRTAPAISPDGTLLVYLAPSNGVLSVWVRTIGKTDDHVVASDPTRPIRNAVFAPDSRNVIFTQDKGGNELFHVYEVGVSGGSVRDLTPYDTVRADIVDIEPDHPTIVIQTNKRNPKLFDAYRLNLASGEQTMIAQNPGDVAGWVTDAAMNVRGALVQNPDGSSEIRVRDSANAGWRTLARYTSDDGFPNPQGFSPDGKSLYVIASASTNAAQLLRYDLATGKSTVVLSDPQYDVGGVLFSAKTKKPILAAIERDRVDWTALDPSWSSDLTAIQAAHPGDLSFPSADRAERNIIVLYTVDDGPAAFYVFDRTTKQATFLFTTRPALENVKLAKMEPIAYQARDGLTIHGYLTLPVGVEPKNLPMVLFPHGGPWGRDSWGYNGYVQWLANRGYAVLQPNFRASTGYGKNFLNAGNRQWAGTMRTDLLDAVAWAASQGYADPKRTCIMGGSYGGYAVLAGLAFSPSAYTCGVDIVGPSNLNTLLQSIPPYWETGRAMFALRMGDNVDFLNSQSPLFKADQITAPLLIGQGANDPRVNIRESNQIVAAMRKNGRTVEYVVFPDEGHGFARPENNVRFNAAVEAFLAKYLSGRVEPAGPNESIEPFLK
ncbi:MAG: S9 family peptidase [Candidatus Eremiobacteraeota bacterium]|nr:S9 family peptidase [Candidatus Eremiobacteraeota bacterium]MBV8367193.1 S9 family peptidase [Candidatus Eremiobacteraeota bacterium]